MVVPEPAVEADEVAMEELGFNLFYVVRFRYGERGWRSYGSGGLKGSGGGSTAATDGQTPSSGERVPSSNYRYNIIILWQFITTDQLPPDGGNRKGTTCPNSSGNTRQNDEYLPAKTGSNAPPPPSGFITVPNEQVGSYSTNDYDINKQNFYNESTGVGGVTVSVRKIPKTTLVSPSGQRIIA